MIRRLRIKFIIAAVFSLFAVLACIIGISLTVSYKGICSDSDRTLFMLSQNGGEFADKVFKPEPELPFESRYFTVDFDPDMHVVSVNTERIAAIDEETAKEYASELLHRYEKKLENVSVQDYRNEADAEAKPEMPVYDKKHDPQEKPVPGSPDAESVMDERGMALFRDNSIRGFTGNYRYAVIKTQNGIAVLFLDCRRSLDGLGTFALSAVTAAFSGICAVAVLVTLLSAKIVRPVAESYEKQRRFITDAGHEIKTPLSIINADADILLMDMEDNEWLSEIKHQVRHLTELTNDLISLSRMEENAYLKDTSNVDLSVIVNEELKAFAGPAAVKKMEFKCSIENGCIVSGDMKMLRRLVSILLDNAVKYSPDEGETDIILSTYRGQAVLSVSNAAEGLDAEKTEKLFDRFYRADSARNSETGGFGIGLSMAKAITEAHGGRIKAYLSDDKIFTVEFKLPVIRR